jgi:multiple sugar transport system substrate-binding protein
VVLPAVAKAQPDGFVKVLNINQDVIAGKRVAWIAAKEPRHVWSADWGGDGVASVRVTVVPAAFGMCTKRNL